MLMYDEKPKFSYGDKPKTDYSMEPERGGCLTAFLGLSFVVNLLAIPAALYLQSQINDLSGSAYVDSAQLGVAQFFVLAAVISGIAGAVCIWGLWNWKRWGYQGLIALQIIGVVLNLFGGTPQYAVSGIVGLGILVYLMKDKTDYLE